VIPPVLPVSLYQELQHLYQFQWANIPNLTERTDVVPIYEKFSLAYDKFDEEWTFEFLGGNLFAYGKRRRNSVLLMPRTLLPATLELDKPFKSKDDYNKNTVRANLIIFLQVCKAYFTQEQFESERWFYRPDPAQPRPDGSNVKEGPSDGTGSRADKIDQEKLQQPTTNIKRVFSIRANADIPREERLKYFLTGRARLKEKRCCTINWGWLTQFLLSTGELSTLLHLLALVDRANNKEWDGGGYEVFLSRLELFLQYLHHKRHVAMYNLIISATSVDQLYFNLMRIRSDCETMKQFHLKAFVATVSGIVTLTPIVIRYVNPEL